LRHVQRSLLPLPQQAAVIFKLQEQKAAGERVKELERKVKQHTELITSLQEQSNSSRMRIEVLEAELDETEDKLI